MNKRGQFYLITAIILIAMIVGIATVNNSIQKEDLSEFGIRAEELNVEIQYVLDYASVNSGKDSKLTDFAEMYSLNSGIDNLYFVIGNSSNISIGAYQRFSNGRILANNVEMDIAKGVYGTKTFDPTGNTVTLTINEIEHVFNLNQGKNFYYLISSGIEGGEYYFKTNGK